MLIEVLVSALILVIASAGVVALLQTTVHAQSDLRLSSEAYSLAQEDQARLATTQLAKLNRLNEKRELVVNGHLFYVTSTGLFVNDQTSTQSCGEQTSTADYVRVTSQVTWPGMQNTEKAEIESIISPSNGSLDPNHGTLAVFARGDTLVPAAGLELFATGGAFSGITDAEGCAVFSDLAPGNYTLNVNGTIAGLVNQKSEYTESKLVGAESARTKRVELRFDRAGTVALGFKYRVGSSGTFATSSASSAMVFNSASGTSSRAYFSPGGGREAVLNLTPLFPFTSSYSIYAGSCSSDNPNPSAETNPPTAPAIANVTALRGQSVQASLQLPAFEPTVWTGKSSSSKGTGFEGADVWVRDANCKTVGGSEFLTYRFTTDSAGKLIDPTTRQPADLGFPWGVYSVCVDNNLSGTEERKVPLTSFAIKTLTAATSRNFYLGAGGEAVSGHCP
jgi:type II secretory pathway pseudopilin PulG